MNKTLVFLVGMMLIISSSGFAVEYPMLEGVQALSVYIENAGLEPNELPAKNLVMLQTHIVKRLKEEGIRIAVVAENPLPPELKITVNILAVPDTEHFVFHMESSLYQFVYIADKRDLQTLAPVWRSRVIMQSVKDEDVNKAVTKAALKQVNEFIATWKAAQIKQRHGHAALVAMPSESNSIHKHPPAAPTVRLASANLETYIASKNSKVFHKAECSATKTISAGNVVTFASRIEATSSGRRPCKKCNP